MQAVLHQIDSEVLKILSRHSRSPGLEFRAPAEPGAWIAVHRGPIYLDIIEVFVEKVAICKNDYEYQFSCLSPS